MRPILTGVGSTTDHALMPICQRDNDSYVTAENADPHSESRRLGTVVMVCIAKECSDAFCRATAGAGTEVSAFW